MIVIGFIAAIVVPVFMVLWGVRLRKNPPAYLQGRLSSVSYTHLTAGFILSDKVNHAKIKNERGENARWGISQYLKYGLQNYAIQLGIAVICIWLIL